MMRRSGAENAIETHSRRDMSSSSGFRSSSSVTVTGSSAMPQIGHEPGWLRTISGCIGQVYVCPGAAGAGGGGAGPRYVCGDARNFSRHFGLQKK